MDSFVRSLNENFMCNDRYAPYCCGCGFESRSSRHVNEPWASPSITVLLHVALRRVNSAIVSIAVVGSASERLML